ncbi:tripartite tricarboxylate transporter substrate binding protein [Pusillimonas sp. TS35]|uniref:Bug family tripartite tricarboxylate transporter substrate binding protein n=1 Tax=Paracandidimonas lactea TaxID=2895524 RepID=UPI00136E234E|nr:tripartite tricarboxylate transporter substrate binding protein [Paracandidimonas lactea]MYN11816.1 tripartite tricarboxylate transporter substrate binding protein [Pusillimonas sp. TS35]
MQPLRRKVVGLIITGMLAAAAGVPAAYAADAWPSRMIRVVVPYPPGGSADLLGRLVAKKLSEAEPGAKVVVENISGGATVPGALSVLKDPADGHTLFMASDNTLNLNHWLLKNPGYDADKDFTPVTVLNTYPHWLIVNPNGKHKDFASFVDYIRANPGMASISVNTVGGSAYLALDAWRRANKLDFMIVPYRGSPPAVTDLIGGQTDAHVDVVGSSVALARGGKVKPIAVLQTDPLDEFPDAATQNYDDPKALTVRANLSVVVRSGAPQPVIDKIYAILNKGVKDPDFVKALADLKYPAVMIEPAKAQAFVRGETQRYGKLVAESGLEKQ